MTGLRFCAHTGRFKDKRAVAVSRWDRAVFLDLAGAYGNIYCVNDWIYLEIYGFMEE